jgi:hypothetical protein
MKTGTTTVRLLAALAMACGAAGHAAAQLRAPVEASYSFATASIGLLPLPNRAQPAPAWESPARRLSLLDLPADGPAADRIRGSYALGFTSETMRSWMTDMGMDAASCIAPIIRLRSRIDTGSDYRGALWVHARCSLR